MNRLAFLLLIWASCSPPEKKLAESPPFDLSSFMRMEATRLEISKAGLTKTIIWNGRSETEHNLAPKWTDELMLAQGLREDTLYWHQKFSVEKSESEHGFIYHYTALEEEYPVRDIQIKLNPKQQITSMLIFSYSSTPLFETARISRYFPGREFSLHGFSRVRTLEPVSYHIISKIQ